MVYMAKKLLRDGRALIRTIGDRGIERHFQKVDQFRYSRISKLSNFVLIRGYKVIMEELENESNSDVRQLLVNNLLEIETELKKRDLLDDARSV
jgi:hypothetical protein